MHLQDRQSLCAQVSVPQAGEECARLAAYMPKKMLWVVDAAIAACRQPVLAEGSPPAHQGQAPAMQSRPGQAQRRACRSQSFSLAPRTRCLWSR